MPSFDKDTLESLRYTELVKLAKEHGAYRRYAPKTELIEKLFALSETPAENLNDVSMPSFMENDDTESDSSDQNAENVVPEVVKSSHEMPKGNIAKVRDNREAFSPRAPLMDKGRSINTSSMGNLAVSINSRKSTPQSATRFLAGPTNNRRKMNRQKATDLQASRNATCRRTTRQQTFEVENFGSDERPRPPNQEETSIRSPHILKREGTLDVEDSTKLAENDGLHKPITRTLRREGTFEIESPEGGAKKKSCAQTGTLKRDRTFELDSSSSKINSSTNETLSPPNQEETSIRSPHILKREGTFDVEDSTKLAENDGLHKPITRTLRRERTFEIESPKGGAKKKSCAQTGTLKRDRTFELDSSSSKINCSTNETLRDQEGKQTLKVMSRTSHLKLPERTSLRSPLVMNRNSIATPSSVLLIEKSKNEKSIPRRFINSHAKLTESVSPSARASSSKSKIPSLMAEIQRKKDQVSAKKLADATGEKQSLVKKAPDFNAIHKRLFGKMESLVDSKQKVIDRANSLQKCQRLKKSPPNVKVVRKLLSPKVGKSKYASPKPELKKAPSAFASNVVSIQKRPSIGSIIPGVSKLQSPKVGLQFNSIASGIPMKGSVIKAAEPARREVFKAAVMGRKPIKRNSPMSKAKQCLQSVRLNKRFELQMKHRLAQQGM